MEWKIEVAHNGDAIAAMSRELTKGRNTGDGTFADAGFSSEMSPASAWPIHCLHAPTS
jgi:hypothetical protein